jgi:hypothetical protein
MRTLLFCLLATTAYGEERTWTISYTTQAELVEVQGNTVFLKSGDTIQSVPLAGLSEADQKYVSSLPLAPVFAGTAAVSNPEGLPAPMFDASVADMPSQTSSGERSLLMSPGSAVTRTEYIENATLPTPELVQEQPAMQRSVPQNLNNSNQQRPMTLKQQRAADKQRADADSRRGLFGGRNRGLLGGRN